MWKQLRITAPAKSLCGSPLAELLSRAEEAANHGQARSPSVSVALPPHSEAWRARSGGETCSPLILHALGDYIAVRGFQRTDRRARVRPRASSVRARLSSRSVHRLCSHPTMSRTSLRQTHSQLAKTGIHHPCRPVCLPNGAPPRLSRH